MTTVATIAAVAIVDKSFLPPHPSFSRRGEFPTSSGPFVRAFIRLQGKRASAAPSSRRTGQTIRPEFGLSNAPAVTVSAAAAAAATHAHARVLACCLAVCRSLSLSALLVLASLVVRARSRGSELSFLSLTLPSVCSAEEGRFTPFSLRPEEEVRERCVEPYGECALPKHKST